MKPPTTRPGNMRVVTSALIVQAAAAAYGSVVLPTPIVEFTRRKIKQLQACAGRA
jgi:hypothetical protein